MNDMRMGAAATTTPHYVVLDTETTGLFDFKAPADAEHQPRLATFAAVLTDADGNEVDRVSLYVRPDGWSIEGTQAAEINGLTDDVLRERGVPVHDVLSLWNHWIDSGAIMVAFNADFDTKVMRGELRRAGLPDRFEATKKLCVMKALKPYAKQGLAVKGAGFVKLETACAFFGITNAAAHTAMADAEAAFHVLRRLMVDGHVAGNPDLGRGQIPQDVEAPPPAGHNMPPEEISESPILDEDIIQADDPIDAALAPYGDVIAEAENWLDGTPVENEGQMKAVDDLLKGLKEARKAFTAAEEEAAKPLYEAWKKEKERWKPTLADLDRMVKGLAKLMDGFKRKLAAEQEAARRKAFEEAEAKRRAAEEAAREAAAGDIEAQREAAARIEEAKRADEAARATSREKVKGLRTVHKHVVEDHKAALNWIAKNDREAVTRFIESYVADNFRKRTIDGVRSWEEKEAF